MKVLIASGLVLSAATAPLGANASRESSYHVLELGAVEVKYSTQGYGPSIVLLHDSTSEDHEWARAASKLASRFQVTLLEIGDLAADSDSVRTLRHALRHLGMDHDTRISGSANGERLATKYALTFPLETQSFILPHHSEDIKILADLLNATPSIKS